MFNCPKGDHWGGEGDHLLSLPIAFTLAAFKLAGMAGLGTVIYPKRKHNKPSPVYLLPPAPGKEACSLPTSRASGALVSGQRQGGPHAGCHCEWSGLACRRDRCAPKAHVFPKPWNPELCPSEGVSSLLLTPKKEGTFSRDTSVTSEY